MSRAFTLIEMLAVVAIVGMIAGIGAVRLAATSEAAGLRAAAASWQDLDAHARLAARSAGPIAMTLDEQAGSVRLHDATGARLRHVTLPRGVTARLEAQPINFDRSGRSDDYDADLDAGDGGRDAAAAGAAVRWRVHGLTGLITERDR